MRERAKTFPFGLVERLVGGCQQVRSLERRAGQRAVRGGKAEGGTGAVRLPARRTEDVLAKSSVDSLDSGGGERSAKQETELVAAQPSSQIFRSEFFQDRAREEYEDGVARRVSEGVVDELEAIEVGYRTVKPAPSNVADAAESSSRRQCLRLASPVSGSWVAS